LPFVFLFKPNLSRKVPINYALLIIFTLAYSCLLTSLHFIYDAQVILISAAMTCGVTISLFLASLFIEGTQWSGRSFLAFSLM
jgi:FtsH-binding integral membrane protein